MTKKMSTQEITKLAAETGIQGGWEHFETGCPICGDSTNVYILDDNRTCYCINCSEEFAILHNGETDEPITSDSFLDSEFAEANKYASTLVDVTHNGNTSTQKTLPGFEHKPLGTSGNVNTSGTGYTSYTYRNTCTHTPQHIIAGRGWNVYAGKKWDVKSHANEYDVVLNLQWDSIAERIEIPIPALKHWETESKKFEEIRIDWPDYGVTTLPRKFWEELVAYLKSEKKSLLVFCMGGHGRTGTAIACLVVCGLGWSASRAIKWVRKNYCDEAIETTGQENYVYAIAKAGRKIATEKN